MADSNLIVTVYRIDYLAMIHNIKTEETFLLFEVFAIFSQANIEGSRCIVWSDKNFFLENYAVLRGSIFVRVLKRLNLLDFFKVEFRTIRN
jgi:hypothetical protein